MELSQIRYFTTLARTLNFTRAAEACNVTQPALTKAIQKLEDEFGGPLFHRERHLTQLTELGRLMLPLLEQAQTAAQAAKRQAAAFRHRENSPLRVGLDVSLSASLLTPIFAELSRHVSALDLTLGQLGSAALCERLMSGEIEAAILVDGERLPERMHRWPLFQERLVLLCPPGHRLVAHDPVPIATLAEECVLMPDVAGGSLRAALEGLCAETAIAPRIRYAADSDGQIEEMVKASLGVTLAGERRPVSPPLVARPLGPPAKTRAVLLAAVAGRMHGPTLAAFLKLVRARSWDLPVLQSTAA